MLLLKIYLELEYTIYNTFFRNKGSILYEMPHHQQNS